MQNRLKKLKSILKSKNLEAIIVTNHFNIYYLTGFRGISPTEREAILVISSTRAVLITARLYQHEASKLASNDLKIKIAAERNEINEFLKESLANSKTIAFEEHDLKFSEFREFKKLLKGKNLVAVKHLIEDLRVIKTETEIKNIERAQIISQRAFEQVTKTLKVGQAEAEIAEKLASIINSLGGQGLAFESIIASGPNSALPHYVSGSRKIKLGEVLLFDFGAKFSGYSADLSRTIFVGRARDEHAKIYHHVASAQQKAIDKIKLPIRASYAHKVATSYFKKNNLEEHFLHSLGHGIGLDVHEKPSVSKKSRDILKEGMVFSVEPGLYFPAWGGVRIEDLVVIRNGKAKILGQSSQFLEI